MRSINSKSIILGADFIFSSLKKSKSDHNMKLLLFTERTCVHYVKCSVLRVAYVPL